MFKTVEVSLISTPSFVTIGGEKVRLNDALNLYFFLQYVNILDSLLDSCFLFSIVTNYCVYCDKYSGKSRYIRNR